MKVRICRTGTGLSAYILKKDLEEPIVAVQHEGLWGGWARLANGWVLDLPMRAPDTRLPITVDAKRRGAEPEERGDGT